MTPSARPDVNLVPAWVKDALFYQIFPDRFCRSQAPSPDGRFRFQPWGTAPDWYGYQGGDLRGIIEKLDYLQGLNVTALYLNPIFASAANHRYHTYDYFAVDPLLGGNDAFRALLDAVHARGMRLIVDGVFNHVGRGFWAFHHVLENRQASPYADWFTIHGFPLQAYPPDDKGPCNYEAWWGLPALPKLNVAHPDVQAYLWQVAEHWIRFGIDGWRLDVPTEIQVPGFWQQFRARVKRINPEAYIVGEVWDGGREWLAGDTFDGITNYAFGRYALGFFGRRALPAETMAISGHPVPRLTAEDFAQGVERMIRGQAWAFTQGNLNYLDSHDTPRILRLADGDAAAVKLMLGFQMTMPGAPILYYGTEIGLDGGPDPDCRRAFPWHATPSWNRELLEHCQWLTDVRTRHAVLRAGRYACLWAQNDAFAFKRFAPDDAAYVVFNAGLQPVALRLEDAYGLQRSCAFRDARTGEAVRGARGALDAVDVPAQSLRIFVRDPA